MQAYFAIILRRVRDQAIRMEDSGKIKIQNKTKLVKQALEAVTKTLNWIENLFKGK